MIKSLLTKSVNLVPWSLRSHIKRIPVVKQIQQAIVNRLLNNAEFDHTINAGPAKGLKYPIVLPQDKLLWTGTWESEFAEILAEKIKPGDVCFDIGSHRGFIAGIMAMSGAKEVHCFEPNPENVGQIKKVVSLNPDHKFQIHECAVSDENGNATFTVMSESSMGQLNNSTFEGGADSMHSFDVTTKRLDSLISESKIAGPSLVKIDVEGAEVAVLNGAVETIEKHHPVLCIEFHTKDLLRAIIEYVEQRDYKHELIEWSKLEEVPEDGIGHIIAF